MIITIQLQTAEELQLLQPLLQLLQKNNAQVQIQDVTPTAASDDKAELKEYPFIPYLRKRRYILRYYM